MAVARKSKYSLNFAEFENLAHKIEEMGGNLHEAVDEALHSTHELITPKLAANIARHNSSGNTAESLDKAPAVVWESPLKAKVNIGFDLTNGGAPSVFLMWGTPRRKASEMPVDKALRNAAFGPAIRREVAQLQREALEAYLQKYLRG